MLRPPGDVLEGTIYTDGSMRDAEPKLGGCCARLGWALVAVKGGRVIASARGLPPAWVDSVPAAEAWALLQATQGAMPGCSFRTDCMSVRLGCRRTLAEATAAAQRHARIWGSILPYFDGASRDTVVWMPAHTSKDAVGKVCLSDGSPLTAVDRDANNEADRLAKSAIDEDRVPEELRILVARVAQRVTDLAEWIGRATAAANSFRADEGGVLTTIRDASTPPRRRLARRGR